MISRQLIRDAIRRQNLIAGLSETPVRSRGLTTDASETAFLELQLTDIDVRLLEVVYPELNMDTIVNVKSDINPGADFYAWDMYDEKGDVSETDDYDDDIQEVEVLGGRSAAQRITGIRGSFGISIMDLRKAQMAGVPIEARKALAARKRMAQKLDKMMAVGSAVRANNGIYGFFNHPSLTAVNANVDVSTINTGAYGAAGSFFASSTGVDWTASAATGKSPNAVVKDLNYGYNQMRTNSKYTVGESLSLVLDKRTFDIWNQTPANIGDPLILYTGNYLEYIKRNCGFIGKIKTTIQANYANGTAATAGVQGLGTAMVVLHDEDREAGEFLVPQPFEVFPPQLRGMKFSTSMHMRVGGQVIRRPEKFQTFTKVQGSTSY
jgi:hypothetical protein